MNSDESRLAALRANYDAVVAKNAANRAAFEKARCFGWSAHSLQASS